LSESKKKKKSQFPKPDGHPVVLSSRKSVLRTLYLTQRNYLNKRVHGIVNPSLTLQHYSKIEQTALPLYTKADAVATHAMKTDCADYKMKKESVNGEGLREETGWRKRQKVSKVCNQFKLDSPSCELLSEESLSEEADRHLYNEKKSIYKTKLLKKHQHRPTGEKPYGCDPCGKRFAHLGTLVKHQRIHTGEKPYGCDQCGMRFACSGTLVSHERIHTGEKPYGCDQCGMRFAQPGTLVKHQRIHTGEKPYGCDQCGMRFACSGTLVSHQRIHTGEKPYGCDQCGKRFAQREALWL
ncbi:hypothetical protein UPYG_G00057040, partial [Umbra pygmaea]